jgi:hypothetical protein
VAEPRTLALHRLPDDLLVDELRMLGTAIVIPAADDLPARVRERIATAPAPDRRPWWRSLGLPARPARRALVLALALIIAIAAIAGAVSLGLPGLRIILGPTSTATLPATPTPPPTSQPPGSAMGLGRLVTPTEAADLLGQALPRIDDPVYGPPDAIYVQGTDDRIVSQVWGRGDGRPVANSHGVTIILTSLPAIVDVDLIKKLATGGADVEFVTVVGTGGYWIEGAHEVLVVGPDGVRIISLRVAGDVLLWSGGGLTHRLESSLGRDASIALAGSVRAP